MKVRTKEILDIVARQGFLCALSGIELLPATAQLDHMVARQRGGNHELSNLQVLNSVINRMKGTMTNEEFVAMCRRVVAWADRDKEHRDG